MTERRTTATSHRLAVGKEVYSADGAMLGRVGHVGRDAFLVRKGFWFLKDSVLPRSTVAQVQGKQVLLAIGRDEAGHLAATPYDFGEDESIVEETRGFAAPPARPVADAAPMRQIVKVIRNDAPAPARTPVLRDHAVRAELHGEEHFSDFSDYGMRAELHGGEHLTVPVVEEELRAHIREVDAGRVRIVKTAVDEQATLQVPVRHEEVYVRQRAVYRPATANDLAQGEHVMEIPLHAQEVVTTKAAVVTGEVEVRKEVTEETEWVTDTVRREEVHVEEGNNGHVHYTDTQPLGGPRPEDTFVLEEAPPVSRRERLRAVR